MAKAKRDDGNKVARVGLTPDTGMVIERRLAESKTAVSRRRISVLIELNLDGINRAASRNARGNVRGLFAHQFHRGR